MEIFENPVEKFVGWRPRLSYYQTTRHYFIGPTLVCSTPKFERYVV